METKYTAADFYGYNEGCSTVKDILTWAKNKEFTYSELAEFSKAVTKDRFLQYLNADKKEHFFEDYFKEAYIHDIEEARGMIKELSVQIASAKYAISRANLEKERLEVFDTKENLVNEVIGLKDWKQKQLDKSKVLDTLDYFFDQSFRKQSYSTTNNVMRNVLTNLIEVAAFRDDDFEQITKRYNFYYWGSNSIEMFYSTSIISGNNSAWKAIEKHLKRTPFIIKSKRCYEGFTFIDEHTRIEYRCTGFNEKGHIKFVYEVAGSQKRLSFDNKSFKEFIKPVKLRAA